MHYNPLPASLHPGAILPNGARVLAARLTEVQAKDAPPTFVVLALNDSHEYVVWNGHIPVSDPNSPLAVPVTYWGNYYPAEYIESLARATATYHHKIGTHAFALLADEIRDMAVDA